MVVKEFVVTFLVVLYVANVADSLSCIRCDERPCEVPTCCESGEYVKDVCGCCPVCARPAGKRCGGPWGISGSCSKDHACLRSCECTTLPSATDSTTHRCVFPFTFKDVKYTGCTTTTSENGNRWCAYEVDENGVAVDGKWADCNDACPSDGEDYPCEESSLFNLDGTCVEASIEAKYAEEKPSFAFRIEAGAAVAEPAPVCKNAIEASRCRCATSVSGEPVGQKAGCTQTTDAAEGSLPSYGWCFLENIEDPSDPTKNCFADALWSHTHGRFWSHRACVPDDVKEPEPIGKNIEDETTLKPAEEVSAAPAE